MHDRLFFLLPFLSFFLPIAFFKKNPTHEISCIHLYLEQYNKINHFQQSSPFPFSSDIIDSTLPFLPLEMQKQRANTLHHQRRYLKQGLSQFQIFYSFIVQYSSISPDTALDHLIANSLQQERIVQQKVVCGEAKSAADVSYLTPYFGLSEVTLTPCLNLSKNLVRVAM